MSTVDLTRAVTDPDKVARKVVVLGLVLNRGGRVARTRSGALLGRRAGAGRRLGEGLRTSAAASQASEGLLKLEKQRFVAVGLDRSKL
jgi:hypothetical protein